MKPTAFGSFSFVQSGIKAYNLEDKSTQARSALVDIALADGAYDAFGTGQSPKPAGAVTVKFKVMATSSSTIDSLLDAFKSAAFSGQQWLTALHNSGSTLQALAKCTGLAAPRVAQTPGQVDAQADFEMAEPYWYAASATAASYASGSVYGTFLVVNNGNAPIRKSQITACGPCVTPTLTNFTNGMSFYYNGSLGVGDLLLIDTGAMQATLNGIDCYGSLVFGSACQIGWMQFEPGSNTLQFTSSPSGLAFAVNYRTTWH